ncbi:MAG TPA: hypothetical protein VMH24_04780 [Candidatus Sulfotelmatobacter sp.]|nr:hypothetical protein [Candidatus Sulfotelmatobacter sp.]
MGIWGWVVLLVVAAALATVVQFALFSRDRRSTDYDWVYLAVGALIGGFTGHAWYAAGPVFDGLNVLPMLGGAVVGAALIEAVYRLALRPREVSR